MDEATPGTNGLPKHAAVTRHLGGTLYEVLISDQNRQQLFSGRVDEFNSSREEAQVILSNLQKWSPAIVECFGTRTTDQILSTPFKVIIESNIGPIIFNEERPLRQYLAVSYCWRHEGVDWPGDGSEAHAPWPFSKPFVDAVLDERGVDSEDPVNRNPEFRYEAIWIDQLCIDQKNEDEKLASIAMMDIIYKRCQKLMVILEDVLLSEDEHQVVNRYGVEDMRLARTGGIEDSDVPHLANVCRKVERSRLWSRSWCWHEFEVNEPWSTQRYKYYQYCSIFVTKAPNGAICKIRWLLLLWIRTMTSGHPSAESDTDLQLSATENLLKISRWAIGDNNISRYLDPVERKPGVSRSSIMTRFYIANTSNCSILSDLVSITVNLSGLGLYFRGHVTDRDELFFIIASVALAAGEKGPLTLMRDRMLCVKGQDSWLSNHAAGYDTSIPNFVIGSNEYIYSITPDAIELDLLFFETLAESPKDEDVSITYQIFPNSPIRSRPPQYRAGYHQWQSYHDDQADDLRRRIFLALVCKCGLSFVLRLWEQLDREVVQVSYNRLPFEPFSTDANQLQAAERLYTLFLGKGGTENGSNLEILHLFLSWLVDPRSMYYISAFCLRVLCGGGADSYALISGPIFRSIEELDREKWRLALPRDLIKTTCTVLRCWVLQPAEDSDSYQSEAGLWESRSRRWRIMGKTLLLGEDLDLPLRDSESDAPTTMLRTRQVVIG